ncbi:MAG: hypothetical protein LBE35_10975 [Clostridiales bacterium]|jgi:amidase|nr:hypothetical protein [Clostridiales bacterium]
MRKFKKIAVIVMIFIMTAAFAITARAAVDIDSVSIPEIQSMVREGQLTYEELTETFLARIARYDGVLRSIIALSPEAVGRAIAADNAVRANPDLAQGMFGIPVLLKDNINFMGLPTTGGALALADNMAEFNATLVENLLDAGAIILGKANLSELAGVVTHVPAFSAVGGLTVHPFAPFDAEASPAGSSSGSAVAVAASLAAVAVGTETTGSIQGPAAAVQVAAIKPTVGLVSTHGVIPIAETRDAPGPMARNLTDAAILLNAMAGGDVDFTPNLGPNGLQGLRIGVLTDVLGDITALSDGALANFNAMLAVLEQAGATIVMAEDGGFLAFDPEISLAHLMTSATNMYTELVIYLDEFLASLPQGFPIRSTAELHAFNAANPEAIPHEQMALDLAITMDLTDMDAVMAGILGERDAVAALIDAMLAEHNLDMIIGVDFSPFAAVAGYPVVSVPLYLNEDAVGLSTNAIFIGTAFSDARLIEAAFVAEQGTNFRQSPVLFGPVRSVFEPLGFDVGWDNETRQVTLVRGADALALTIDSDIFTLNGAPHNLPQAPQIVDGTTMAPIEPLLSAVGLDSGENGGRNALWVEDVEQFRDAVMHVHPRFWDDSEIFIPADAAGGVGGLGIWYNLEFNELSRRNFLREIDELLENIPNFSDTQILIALQSAAAKLNDNHFRFLPSWDASEIFPLGLSHFGGMSGGFYLTQASADFANALNHRLAAINGVVIGEIIDMFAEIYPTENIYDVWRFLPNQIIALPMLEYLGLWNDGAIFAFEGADGNIVEIALTQANLGMAEMYDLRSEGDLPDFLNMRDHNSFRFIEEYGILYIRIEAFSPNRIIALMAGDDHPAGVETLLNTAILEPLTQIPEGVTDPMEQVMLLFGIYEGGDRENWAPVPEIVSLFESGAVQAVIVDARGNPGGDQLPFLPLLRYIAEHTAEGRFFYLTNHQSGSAAFMTTMITAYMGFTTAGTPPAQNTLFHGLNQIDQERSAMFALPNAGMYITIPNRFMHLGEELSGLPSVGISAEAFLERFPNLEFYAFTPDVEIVHTIEDWFNNTDPAINHVISIVGE